MTNSSFRRRTRSAMAAGLLSLAFGGSLAFGSDCASPGFVGPDLYPLEFGTGLFVSAEVTSDAYTDLIFAGQGPQTITVIPGEADGTLGGPITTASDDGAELIAAADFNQDGKTDVITYAFLTRLLLFLGNGDGTFQAPTEVGFSMNVRQLLAADVDNDGEPDVVATEDAWLTVYLSNGDGTFDGPFRTPVWPTGKLALGDVDGDGRLDAVGPGPLASGESRPRTVVYYPGRGDGTFDPSLIVGSPSFEVESVTVADVTGEGNLDVLVISRYWVVTFPGHGNGVFDPGIVTFAPPKPAAILVADLDSDGYADLGLVQSSEYSPTFAGGLDIYLGNGDGTFRFDAKYATGLTPYAYGFVDIGDDGRVDFVLRPSDFPLEVLSGNGDGTLRGVPLIANGLSTRGLVAADFNEDGRLDMAVVGNFENISSSYIRLELGTAGGKFTPGDSISPGGQLSSLATADFNGDSHFDLATLAWDSASLVTYLGHGDGTFTAFASVPLPSVSFYSRILLADLNADGVVDVVTVDPGGTSDSVGIFLGNGNGTFEARPPLSLPFAVGGLALERFDADGFPDLVAVGVVGGPGELDLLHGNGDGSFGPPTAYPAGDFPASLTTGDFDGDGHADVIVTLQAETGLLFYKGSGSGTLADPVAQDVGVFVGFQAAMAVADFDADGHADLLTATGGGSAALLLGNGNGTFQPPALYLVGMWAQAIALGDIDGNGTLDAMVGDGNYSGGGIGLLFNAIRAVSVPPAVNGAPGLPLVVEGEAAGFGLVTYQWRRDGQPLSDGGRISGATTRVLSIQPAAFGDAGAYDLVVTDACGSTISAATAVSVEYFDVPVSSPFHDDIEAITAAGISGGCGAGNYCPTSPVRRDQMAVFLLKAEHGSAYTPPACAGVFDDVPCPGPFTDWVEQLAAEGITSGCGGDNYCPGPSVTRAQMAIFLLKTSEGSAYTPPPAVGVFDDVPVGSFAADFIEDLYGRGITGGCQLSPLLYCPGSAVLRQQMATFLARTFLP